MPSKGRDGVIKTTLKLDVQGFTTPLQAASKDTEAFAERMKKSSEESKKSSQQTQEDNKKVKKSLSDVAGEANRVALGFAAVGAASLAAYGAAVKAYMGFDQAMSKVSATGQDARDNIDELRALAIKAGADTQYSAAEAAQAITDLAKAGMSAADIMGGGLAGALSLAAAGEMGVAAAAEASAMLLSQFQLSASQAEHTSDLLAAAAGKAAGEVSDFVQAFQQVGLVSKQTGLSLEEATGTLAMFAQNGLLGSDAGTSLKTMLQRLTPQSTAAKREFDRLGISAYDSGGKFVGMANFAGQLNDKMGTLTDQSRNAALKVMFGSDAIRAASLLYQAGAQDVENWTQAVSESGYASRAAWQLTNNLAGDIERLGGSIETVFIQAGSGANQTLRGIVQTAGGIVDAIGQIPEPVMKATMSIAGSGGLATLGVAGMLKLSTSAGEGLKAFKKLAGVLPGLKGLSTLGTGLALGGITAGLTLVTMALGDWAERTAEAKQRTEELKATLEGFGAATAATSKAIEEGISKNVNEDMLVKFGMSAERLRQAIEGDSAALEEFHQNMARYKDIDLTTGEEVTFGVGNDVLIEYSRYANALEESIALKEKEAVAEAHTAMQAWGTVEAKKAAIDTNKDQIASIDEVIAALEKEANTFIAGHDAQIAENQAKTAASELAKKLAKDKKALHEATNKSHTAFNLETKSGQEATQALDKYGQSVMRNAGQMIAQGKSAEEAKKHVAAGREEAIKMAKQFGLNGKAAKEYADGLKLVPGQVDTNLNVSAGGSIGTVESVRNALAGLPSQTQIMIMSYIKGDGTADINGLREAIAKLPDKEQVDIYSHLVTTGIDLWNQWTPKTKTAKVSIDFVQRAKAKGINIGSPDGDFATGGAISGPGTGTSDDILTWLSNGEHVWTAREVAAVGGQHNMYQLRQMALDGSLADLMEADGYASGGTVASKKKTKKQLAAAAAKKKKQAAAAAKKRQAEAEKAAENRVKSAEKPLSTAQGYVSDLAGDRVSFATDIRRGTLAETVTSGRGLSVVDQMISWSQNAAFGAQRSVLAKAAQTYETQLTGLYKLMEQANARVEELSRIYDQVKSNLNRFDLAGMLTGDAEGVWEKTVGATGDQYWTKGGAAGSASALTAAAQARAQAIKSFAGKLDQLRRLGMSAAVLQEIASLGTEQGSQVADMFISDATQIGAMNDAYRDIDVFSGLAAQYVTEASHEGGLAAAKSFADGIQKSLNDVARAMAATMDNALVAASMEARKAEAAAAKTLAEAKTALNKLQEAAKKSGSSVVNFTESWGTLQARASGGAVNAHQPYLVGERGAEIIIPTQPGYVIDSATLRGLTSQPQRTTTTTVNVVNNYPQAEPASRTVNDALALLAAKGR